MMYVHVGVGKLRHENLGMGPGITCLETHWHALNLLLVVRTQCNDKSDGSE